MLRLRGILGKLFKGAYKIRKKKEFQHWDASVCVCVCVCYYWLRLYGWCAIVFGFYQPSFYINV